MNKEELEKFIKFVKDNNLTNLSVSRALAKYLSFQ